MPDHLHLLIKIRATPDRVALGVLVSQLAKALRNAYWQIVAADAATGKTRAPSLAESAVGPASGIAQIGRMLFLSLYEAMPRQPTRAELYHRCHEMIDLALTKLA